jgi:OmpA-OmpF porin, OOP family
MKLKTLLLAGSILALPAAAMAQPIEGLYVGAGVGVQVPQNTSTKSSPAVALGLPKARLQYDPGFNGVLSVGYGFGNGLRVELEGSYGTSRIRQYHGTSFPTAAGGDQDTYGVMGNVLYDFDVGMPWMVPYVGVGGGYKWTELKGFHAYNVNAPFRLGVDDTVGNFAYQGILGAAFPIESVPGLALTAEYRYEGIMGDNAYHGTVIAPPAGGGPAIVKRGNFDLEDQGNHVFLVGLRYAFNVAPAAPPPAPAPVAAPAPAPARTYLVFFDWDKADLTDRARQVIAEAAQASTRVAVTRIEVSGHADRTGTAAYNQKLSLRRAQNVAAELVRLGVQQSAIDIQGYGDTRPLVPTAAGVREPQNRRVEIVLK